jgi:oxygen-dependent protoporphyrinogen oxidase
VKLSWKLLSISKLDNGEYSLTYETPEGVVSLQSKSVVMTIPSHIASPLLRPLSVSFSQKWIIPMFYVMKVILVEYLDLAHMSELVFV